MTVDPKALRQARLNFGLTREQAAEGGFLSGLGRRRGEESLCPRRSWGQNPSTACRRSPSLWQGRLAKDGAAGYK